MNRTTTRRQLLALMGSTAVAATAQQPPKPNILLILIDDFGWASVGCYGNKLVPTPHIDKMAAEGVRFTDAYVTPQCTPTRATLLTGQYTARNKMWHVIPGYRIPHAWMQEPRYRVNLDRSTFTVAKGLQQAGYRTGIFGKWHLTANDDGSYNELKAEASHHYGFDVTNTPLKPRENQTGDKAVDKLTDESVAFMKRAAADRKPFFCYLSHHTAHGPLSAPQHLVDKWAAKGYPATGENNATYLAMIEHLDNSIGRLMAQLPANTAVFFTTDNGGIWEGYSPVSKTVPGQPVHLQVQQRAFSNAPLRNGKGFAYEGGIRVPLIVRWPGVVKPGTANATPVHIVDFLPTFLGMAGGAVPKSHTLDGVSLQPLLEGRKIAQRALYFWMPHYDLRWLGTPSAVIREGDWKLIEYFGDHVDESRDALYIREPKVELFNLREDIGEKRDLAAAQPERTRRLRQKLHAWIKANGESIPSRNPNFDPAKALEEQRGPGPNALPGTM